MAVRAGLSIIFVLLLTAGGNAQEPTDSSPALLPPPPPGPLVFAGPLPEDPFQPEAGNVFSRTVFATPSPLNTRIEVRDVLVPPDDHGEVAALPGPALLEVLQGQGTLSLRGQERPRGQGALSLHGQEKPLADGEILLIPAGRAVAITNITPRPMTLRLYLFEAG